MRLLYEVFGVHGRGQIRRDRHHLAVGFAGDLGRGGLQRLLSTGADRNVDTLAGQDTGDPFPDTGAPAGDQRRLAIQFQIHSFTPKWSLEFSGLGLR